MDGYQPLLLNYAIDRPMNIRLVLGRSEVDLDFEGEDDRDVWWNNMTQRQGWDMSWAEKIGLRTIRMHPERMPIHWKWDLAVPNPKLRDTTLTF